MPFSLGVKDIPEAVAKEAEAKAAAEAEEQAKLDAKAAEVAARHEQA